MEDKWMPREQWQKMVLGQDCPLCSNVNTPGGETNDFNKFIADMSMSRLVLDKNQYIKGYCILICFKHVREPYELPRDEREMFFEDMMRAGLALEYVFKADKMNFQLLGNAVPHLHAHIEPRYLGDPAPHRPIRSGDGSVVLTLEEYRDRVKQIRAALDIVETG
jgi:diadenosine tetraphosphate (Ap4A) HIT family hydrolase